MTQDDWREALKSADKFNDFIVDYFRKHKKLSGNYDIPAYYEHYTVKLDSNDGLIITLTTGMNQGGSSVLPYKQTEKMSIEDFRRLLLHKKFADEKMSLADVFQVLAGVPDKDDN